MIAEMRSESRAALSLLIAVALAPASDVPRARHITVYKEAGRFGGWPANNGAWSWGNEILVGFGSGYFKLLTSDRHQYDSTKPKEPRLARSLDGGETWTIEAPPSLLPPEQGGKAETDLDEPMNFTDPNFAMTLRLTDANTSRFWYSTDRGKNWRGPFRFPMLGQKGVMARTDYLVTSSREALAFLTAAKSNGREGRVFCARSTDGGLHWEFVGFAGEEPPGFSIMPSTVRLSPAKLLMATRTAERPAVTSIDLFSSDNNGATWKFLGKPAPSAGAFNGNAPSMIRLRDGRICLTYGFRNPPFGVRARFSRDEGRTWSEEIILRNDGAAWDVGYPRTVQRPDGKIVTVYYFAEQPHTERTIVATIWDAP
jgi:hypothetical protein